ncbi:MAG: hypothetical protein Q4E57_09275, partial [Eubacteriales bacterium]|nr:hypothetical protein [Eubacteriales bacterium]
CALLFCAAIYVKTPVCVETYICVKAFVGVKIIELHILNYCSLKHKILQVISIFMTRCGGLSFAGPKNAKRLPLCPDLH